MKEFTIVDIANTDTTLTVENPESEIWHLKADLAAEMANDQDFQKAVVDGVAIMRRGDPTTVMDGLNLIGSAEEKFKKNPHFDAAVSQAAYRAVLFELDN